MIGISEEWIKSIAPQKKGFCREQSVISLQHDNYNRIVLTKC